MECPVAVPDALPQDFELTAAVAIAGGPSTQRATYSSTGRWAAPSAESVT